MKKISTVIVLLLITIYSQAGETINYVLQDIFFTLGQTTLLQSDVSLIARGYNKDTQFNDNGETCICYTSSLQDQNGSFRRAFVYSKDGKTVSKYDICFCTRLELRDELFKKIDSEMSLGWGADAYCGDFDKKYVDFGSSIMVASPEYLEVNLHDIPTIKISFYTKDAFGPVLVEWKKVCREKSVTISTPAFFDGGKEGLQEYFKTNIVYPKYCLENNIQGVVLAKVKIEEDGMVSNVNIERGVDPQIDAEAKRVISAMPRWNPAIASDGLPIRSEIAVPVVFKCVPQPKIIMTFYPTGIEVSKYGSYDVDSFEEGSIVYDVTIDVSGKIQNVKLNKKLTTISNSKILSATQKMVLGSKYETCKSKYKGQIKVTLQYVL